MTFLEKIKAILMVPVARGHLKKIIKLLETHSYDTLINDSLISTRENNSINVINVTVKAYFWAARTITDCKCLPRSIALYQKLRATGYQAEHKFGVNKQDKSFVAHAWVEFQNKPLNEAADLKQRFTVMNAPD